MQPFFFRGLSLLCKQQIYVKTSGVKNKANEQLNVQQEEQLIETAKTLQIFELFKKLVELLEKGKLKNPNGLITKRDIEIIQSKKKQKCDN